MTTQKISKSALQNALRRANNAIDELRILKGDYAIQSATENSADFIIKRDGKVLTRVVAGAKGKEGAKGLQGWPGTSGKTGKKGIKGDQGVKGLQGLRGYTGNRGETGKTGEFGTVGGVGAQGEQGIQGKTGQMGANGLKGERGEHGEQGIVGKDGEKGDIGKRGVSGLTGKDGKQGETGSIGVSGLQGTQGEQGKLGDTGEKGDIGDIPEHKWESTTLFFQTGIDRYGHVQWDKGVNLVGGLRTLGGGGGTSIISFQPMSAQSDGTQVGEDDINTFNFGTGFTITESPDRQINISLAGGGGGGNGGVVHYDYVVDPSLSDDTGQTIIIGTGATVIGYKTIQSAINAAAALTGTKTIRIKTADYNENVTILSATANIIIIGEGKPVENSGNNSGGVNWGNAASGTALTFEDSARAHRFVNINFRGTASVSSSAGLNASPEFDNCRFASSVEGSFAGFSFRDCTFESDLKDGASRQMQNGVFERCGFVSANLALTTGSMLNVNFVDCEWGGVSSVVSISSSGRLVNVKFLECKFRGIKKAFLVNNNSGVHSITIDDCSFDAPSDSNGVIHIQACAANSNLILVNSRFAANGTHPYLKSDDVSLIAIVVGNYMPAGPTDEITGDFTNSVFGPNIPAGWTVNVTSGSGNTSGDSHTKYTDAEAILAVEGEGTLDLTGLVTFVNNIDLNLNELLNAKAENIGSIPSAGNLGRLLYLTTDDHLYMDTG